MSIFEAIDRLSGERQSAAKAIRSSVTQALQADEHVTQLGPALREAQSRAMRLVQQAISDQQSQSSVQPSVVSRQLNNDGDQRSAVSDQSQEDGPVTSNYRENLSIAQVERILDDLKKEVSHHIVSINLSWSITEN